MVGHWGARFMGRSMPCAVGRGGFATSKREGDGCTPIAELRLAHGYFRADRLRRPFTRIPLDPISVRDLWSDDPNDPNYNHHVTTAPQSFSYERLRRGDPLYDIVLVTDWNWPVARPGLGSAIFVHCWRRARFPTEGCIAFNRSDLLWLLAHWQADSRILIQP